MASAASKSVAAKACTGVASHLQARLGRRLWADLSNPVGIVQSKISAYFCSANTTGPLKFENINNVIPELVDDPRVTAKENFDDLLFPRDHCSRSTSDTYYIGLPASLCSTIPDAPGNHQMSPRGCIPTDSATELLRTHATVHQRYLLRSGFRRAVWAAEVFRKDQVNRTHFPVFNQVDGFCVWPEHGAPSAQNQENGVFGSSMSRGAALDHLKETLEGLVRSLFEGGGGSCSSSTGVISRWNRDSFPFTDPSLELEVEYTVPVLDSRASSLELSGPNIRQTQRVEVAGCGLIHPTILEEDVGPGTVGWAFGMGLDRLAMALCSIPDIRYLWSTDDRFLSQYADGELKPFQIYSKHPASWRDLSVVIPGDHLMQAMSDEDEQQLEALLLRQLSEVVLQEGAEVAEDVQLRDRFLLSDGRRSFGWRIMYRSFQKTLTGSEINAVQDRVIARVQSELGWLVRGG